MTRALMIFDTGPGFRNAEAREAWNQRARQRADDLDARASPPWAPATKCA